MFLFRAGHKFCMKSIEGFLLPLAYAFICKVLLVQSGRNSLDKGKYDSDVLPQSI